MKKLKLNKLAFAGAEVLSRTQLKKVMGGNGSADANVAACEGKSEGASCSYKGSSGTTLNGNCVKGTWTSLYCNIPG